MRGCLVCRQKYIQISHHKTCLYIVQPNHIIPKSPMKMQGHTKPKDLHPHTKPHNPIATQNIRLNKTWLPFQVDSKHNSRLQRFDPTIKHILIFIHRTFTCQLMLLMFYCTKYILSLCNTIFQTLTLEPLLRSRRRDSHILRINQFPSLTCQGRGPNSHITNSQIYSIPRRKYFSLSIKFKSRNFFLFWWSFRVFSHTKRLHPMAKIVQTFGSPLFKECM